MRVDEIHLFENEEPEATIQHSDFWYLVGKSGFVVWNRATQEMKSFPYNMIDATGKSTKLHVALGDIDTLTIRNMDGVIIEEITEEQYDDLERFSKELHEKIFKARKK